MGSSCTSNGAARSRARTKGIGGVVGHLALQHRGHALQARACRGGSAQPRGRDGSHARQLCRPTSSASMPCWRAGPGPCALEEQEEHNLPTSPCPPASTASPKPPTGVHVLGGQVLQLARGLAVELDEHQVPDLQHVGVVCSVGGGATRASGSGPGTTGHAPAGWQSGAPCRPQRWRELLPACSSAPPSRPAATRQSTPCGARSPALTSSGTKRLPMRSKWISAGGRTRAGAR